LCWHDSRFNLSLSLSKQCQRAWLNLRTVCDWLNDSFAGRRKWPFFPGRRVAPHSHWTCMKFTPKYPTGMPGRFAGRQSGAWCLTFRHFSCILISMNYSVHGWTIDVDASFTRYLPDSARGLPPFQCSCRHAQNVVCRFLVAGQLYQSCGFSLTDCQYFPISNPCQEIHSQPHYTIALWQREIFDQIRVFLGYSHI